MAKMLACAVTALFIIAPADAEQQWFMMFPDAGGCWNTTSIPRIPQYARSPDALQQWLRKQGKHPQRKESRDNSGQLHHVVIETPDKSFGAIFFPDFGICESSLSWLPGLQRDQELLERWK
jgi:hypothetical protein